MCLRWLSRPATRYKPRYAMSRGSFAAKLCYSNACNSMLKIYLSGKKYQNPSASPCAYLFATCSSRVRQTPVVQQELSIPCHILTPIFAPFRQALVSYTVSIIVYMYFHMSPPCPQNPGPLPPACPAGPAAEPFSTPAPAPPPAPMPRHPRGLMLLPPDLLETSQIRPQAAVFKEPYHAGPSRLWHRSHSRRSLLAPDLISSEHCLGLLPPLAQAYRISWSQWPQSYRMFSAEHIVRSLVFPGFYLFLPLAPGAVPRGRW